MSEQPETPVEETDEQPTPEVTGTLGGDEAARAEDAAVEGPTPEVTGTAGGDEPDWKDLAHRYAAEADNARKQTAVRVQKASKDGMRRVALELLPALDDFERALAHAEAEEGDDEHTLTKGIRLVQQQMLAALKRAGIETFSPKGEPFDPHLHEAVATTPVEGADSGTVVEVYQAGYRLGDDVLRPAKVVVSA